MRDFFYASLALKEQKNEEGLQQYRGLAHVFPKSDYVVAQTATAHYNLRRKAQLLSIFLSSTAHYESRVENSLLSDLSSFLCFACAFPWRKYVGA
jgi:hypothetical protein